MMHFTELIISQAKTAAVMFCCGILIESFWQIKKMLQQVTDKRTVWLLEEGFFWAASAASLMGYLYYCAFGEITFHAVIGFLAGLLLWKKICCGIINSWEKRDAAENLKITARSSIWTRREKNVWRRGVKKKRVKRKGHAGMPDRVQQAKWPSGDRKQEEES